MGSNSALQPAASYDVRAFDVEYRHAGKESWLARIYQPQGDGPFPAILDVHGGVWNQGSRTNDARFDQALAADGIVVAAIDFRRAPQHPYPAQVADTNYAIRWLKAHAADFNADAQSIGIVGFSSGGQTALLSAMRPRDPRYSEILLPEAPTLDATVRYVVSFWGVLDPYARYLYAQSVGRADLVARTEAYFLTRDCMQEGNPQYILERGESAVLPPTLLIQGTADANVPLEIPERLVAAYRKAGGAMELHLFPGMPHGFAGWPAPEVERALEITKAYVAGRLLANPM